MHERQATTFQGGYDWSRLGRHRLRAPAGVLIDSPLAAAGSGWLGTLWPAGEASGWSRMLWTPDTYLGGWSIPGRLAGGDVIEFGADRADQPLRWYGILDSYDAIEWLTIQGPYPAPRAAYDEAQRILGRMRFTSPIQTQRPRQPCARRRASHRPE